MSEIRVDNITNEEGTGAPNFPLGADGLDPTTPIGGYVIVQTDLVGAAIPDGDKHIKLEAGLTGSGEYNEGKLNNESVSGSAPLVEATAEIVDAESPLNGQVVHLLETERRFMRAGEVGTVEFDQMQRITGEFINWAGDVARPIRADSNNLTGAFEEGASGGSSPTGTTGTGASLLFNSASSPDARASATTDGETRTKNIGVSVYMRIK